MTVPVAFAIIGGVILIGFFANLLFRLTKIPSALLLIAIGVVLGPVTGWLTSISLIEIAPYFGTMALLVILFEGGLELDIASVIRQAPKAALLAILVFLFSAVSVAALAYFLLHMSLLNSLLIAAIFGASSPAICLPIISGLSIKKETQTILKLESTLGDVLLIVTVLLILNFRIAGSQTSMGMVSRFFMSFVVAFLIASVAGALWSRLISWMGKEPLAYMLTLGFVFLLYFSVEELGGSAAIAVLMFGIMLENMHVVADRVGPRVRFFFGIDIRAEQFVLHEFMKNITAELSFLIRTFFFVYLGLILDFKNITPEIAFSSIGIVVLLLACRWLGVQSIKRGCRFTTGESRTILSMLPRGLATAVMAILPMQYGIPDTELLPVYAFTVIILTNILMTVGVISAERRLAQEKAAGLLGPETELPRIPEQPEGMEGIGGNEIGTDGNAGAVDSIAERASTPAFGGVPEKAAVPFSFTNSMARLFGILPENRERRYTEAIKASFFSQPLFWLQIFFASILTVLGLVTNHSAIIIGAALIVPIAWPVIAAGMALAVGDIYLFLKLLLKLALVAIMAAALAAFFSGLLPFSAFTTEIASRTKSTILDFLVAFFAGMAGATLMFSRKRMLPFLPGAVLAVTLLPPLAVMGFSLANGPNIEIFRGGAVLFTANFFAAILGSSLVYALVGMPAVAELKGIHDWKKHELSHPFVNLIFERLRFKSLAGRTGSVRSRLVVAAVFLLALVIPLQIAFNQLSLEFRARQAISEVQKMFQLSGRSDIINSTSSIGEDAIVVRIQVATNAFFTAADIRHFEERISDRTGKPTQLDLMQSLSDIGEGKKVLGMLQAISPAPVEYKPGIPEITVGLREEVEKNLRMVPIPQSIILLRTNAKLNLNGGPSTFRIEYLADDPLSEDAQKLLIDLLERQMQLKAGSLNLAHVPARYSFNPDRSGSISPEEQRKLQMIQNILTEYAPLKASIALPDNGSEKYTETLRAALFAAAPLLEDPANAMIAFREDGDRKTVTIILQPGTS
jgi:cell volume regulation protein A